MSKVEQHVLPHDATALRFLLAGKCYVTLEQIADGKRFTYLIEQKVERGYVDDPKHPGHKVETIVKRHDIWFVSLQPGAIGEARPRYLGIVDPTSFRTTSGTKKNDLATAENVNLFGDILGALRAGKSNAHRTRIWHCGYCGRCARGLSVPASILTGLGPDCAALMGVEMANRVKPTLVEKLASLADPE
jgi:hypothetical protein